MTGDQLIALLGSYKDGDRERFRAVALQAIVALRSESDKERARKVLSAIVDDADGVVMRTLGAKDRNLVYQLPMIDIASLFLSDSISSELWSIIAERGKLDLLREHNIPPRSKILLHGPPGNGKTSIAAALATSLKLPGFCLVLSQVRGSMMGETAAKLHKAFALTEQGGSLLFLDEFDAIATIRSSEKQAASHENSAVVSSLLQMLDNRPQGIIVAATNRIDIIDPAILRRFDVSIEIAAPTEEAAEQFERVLFERHRFSPVGWEPTDSSSFSSIERDVVGFIRSRLLSNEGVKR